MARFTPSAAGAAVEQSSRGPCSQGSGAIRFQHDLGWQTWDHALPGVLPGRHYRMDETADRHFLQSRGAAGLPGTLTRDALEMMADRADQALDEVQRALPASFPGQIHASLKAGLAERLKRPEFL